MSRSCKPRNTGAKSRKKETNTHKKSGTSFFSLDISSRKKFFDKIFAITKSFFSVNIIGYVKFSAARNVK